MSHNSLSRELAHRAHEEEPFRAPPCRPPAYGAVSGTKYRIFGSISLRAAAKVSPSADLARDRREHVTDLVDLAGERLTLGHVEVAMQNADPAMASAWPTSASPDPEERAQRARDVVDLRLVESSDDRQEAELGLPQQALAGRPPRLEQIVDLHLEGICEAPRKIERRSELVSFDAGQSLGGDVGELGDLELRHAESVAVVAHRRADDFGLTLGHGRTPFRVRRPLRMTR